MSTNMVKEGYITMNTPTQQHSKTYYRVRSIVRAIVWVSIIASPFIIVGYLLP
jgi:hypothetical protein